METIKLVPAAVGIEVIKEARRNAASLARDLRTIPLRGSWTRREWNAQVKAAAHRYINNAIRFYLANS